MSTTTLPQRDDAKPLARAGSHHRQLEVVRHLEKCRRLLIAAASATSLIILSAVLLGILDFSLELPTAVRLIAWTAIAFFVAGLAWKLRRWMAFQSCDAVIAAEQAWPDMGQRLRTSHDYQTVPREVAAANPELVRSLEAETEQRVAAHEIEPFGHRWPIVVLGGLCVVTTLSWLIAFVLWPQWRVTTARLMMLPVHYSQVEVEPLPDYVHHGADLAVRIHVDGRPLQSARVLYRAAGDVTWKDKPLQQGDSSLLIGELAALLPNRREDSEVQIEAGQFLSKIYPVEVRIPLVLEEWKATVQPPAYTGLPISEGSPEGLRIPEGSEITLAARYNRTPSEVEVKVTGEATKQTASVIDDELILVSVDAGGEAMQLTVRATAADGMSDESSLLIDVFPDQQPRLKFAAPEENAEAIPTAELRFTPEFVDDYGLAKVGIRYRIDDGEEQTLWETSLDERSEAITHTIYLPLEDLDLSYPQAITYYAYAIDNRVPEPHRVTSDLRFVDIRPFAREYEFKEGQCSGNCQGECLTLEKLIKQQREILGRTFVAAHQQRTPSDVGTKLAGQEQELKTRTETLTAALVQKVGPMPTLDSAAVAMSAAIEDLLDQAIADGQADQEQALADLIAARQNLRKILKLNNSKSQACRRVDQQQLDKIRRPKPNSNQEQDKQEQQLSQVRQQLDLLAKEQESFCESAKACSQASLSAATKPAGERAASSPSRAQLVAQQQESAAKTREIQRELADARFGSLAPERTQQAADSIQQSGELLARANADQQAIAEARKAAEQLKQLSDHLGRRHNPDFSDKLGAAGRQAEQLAQQQRMLSDSLAGRDKEPGRDRDQDGANSSEHEQRHLAGRAAELADLVDQLLTDSMEQEWPIQRTLSEQVSANSPRQAAEGMQQAVEQIAQDRLQPAATSGLAAAETLKRFGTGLQRVQQMLGPARLDQLTKAERQTAAQLKDWQRADSLSERAMAQARTRELAESIRRLARGDAELTEATRTLRNLAEAGSVQSISPTSVDDSPRSPTLDSAPITLSEGLRHVGAVLQQRIQEAILTGSMQQTDGPVPPQYAEMVDEYFRVLSEDVE